MHIVIQILAHVSVMPMVFQLPIIVLVSSFFYAVNCNEAVINQGLGNDNNNFPIPSDGAVIQLLWLVIMVCFLQLFV